MEDPFGPGPLPPVPNLSISIPLGQGFNRSSVGDSAAGLLPPPPTPPSHKVRLVSLGVILVVAVVGNATVLCTLCGSGGGPWAGPKRRKMDFLLVHLALADLYVCGGTVLSQLAWELLGDTHLVAGDLACRVVKLLQVSALLASSNILALICLERHRVVSRPLGPPLPTRALAALGWLLALLLALPQAFVVRGGPVAGLPDGYSGVPVLPSAASTPGSSLVASQSPPGPPSSARTWSGERRCRTIFGALPRWHLQVYTVYGTVAGFLAPLTILGVACGRLLWTLRQQRPQAPAPAAWSPCAWEADHCRAPARCALPRAKVQSLKMTLVLALLFVVCELPYFAAELAAAWSSEPPGEGQGEGLASALGVVVVTNSALNPYVYLFFQAGDSRLRRLWRRLGTVCCCGHCPKKGDGEEEEDEAARGHQPLHRHRWPHHHYHHHRRRERPGASTSEGSLHPPLPPAPKQLPCSCESAF
ncbi:probable G-protein coupled receptor 150 [Dromiciops gliroides]|uniref:probable G-protein coupled receptor 150 n=1 Tax=Dromiciops gliroides TaxID=33562 RepID=UPI001CC448F1|nr:probable G-protein coupled receptor 150 [Dromiciops gliroides]